MIKKLILLSTLVVSLPLIAASADSFHPCDEAAITHFKQDIQKWRDERKILQKNTANYILILEAENATHKLLVNIFEQKINHLEKKSAKK